MCFSVENVRSGGILLLFLGRRENQIPVLEGFAQEKRFHFIAGPSELLIKYIPDRGVASRRNLEDRYPLECETPAYPLQVRVQILNKLLGTLPR